MASIQTRDLVTHADIIKGFALSNRTSQLVDYTTTKEARSARYCMQAWLNEHFFSGDVIIIQRFNDLLLYKPSRFWRKQK